jgi:hypothetical protein
MTFPPETDPANRHRLADDRGGRGREAQAIFSRADCQQVAPIRGVFVAGADDCPVGGEGLAADAKNGERKEKKQ